jgi:type VI secretion system secreted protein VgrG
MIFVSILFAAGAVFSGRYIEPIAYQYFPPSATPSLTPTITLTPSITLTPTITLTPSITNTPAVTDTPTPTSTPFIPPAIEASFASVVTPNPDAIFSPLQFAQSIDNSYQPINPSTQFTNPLRRMYAIFSYDKMTPGVQWTALWLRDGELVHYESKPWDGELGGYGYTDWQPSPDKWLPGNYQVIIFVGTEWKVVGTFTLSGQPPTASPTRFPTYTKTATFTRTATRTKIPTSTRLPTLTPTLTRTKPPTRTPTSTRTATPTRTLSPTRTPTP